MDYYGEVTVEIDPNAADQRFPASMYVDRGDLFEDLREEEPPTRNG